MEARRERSEREAINYRVNNPHDPPQLYRVVQKRDELVPRPPPHIDRPRVLVTEVGLETSKRQFGSLQRRRGIHRPHTGRDLLTIRVGHEFHGISDDVTLMPISA